MDLKLLKEKLKEENPLVTLPKKERLWLIDYSKLRKCFELYHELFSTTYYSCNSNEFPDLEDAYGIQFCNGLPAWKCQSHPVNQVLREIKEELNLLGVEWWKEREHTIPKVICCDRHPCEGCAGCKSFNECKLKLLGKFHQKERCE